MPKLLRKKETRLRSRDSVGTGGFTLIELLVVIAIISLLASVILSLFE